MRIGIIGAGALGQALVRQLVRAGVGVLICNSRGPNSLADLVGIFGPLLTPATLEGAVQPEIVILAVPWAKVFEVLTNLPDWEGRIVIDATNAAGPSDLQAADLGGRTSSEVIAGLALGAHVVKAFNTLPASTLADDPRQGGGRRVIFFSGDHTRSKVEVGRLIDQLGFAGIDLGSLSEGGKLQQFPDGVLSALNLLRIG